MKITKMDMCRVIVTALYNLPQLVTENNKYPWQRVKVMMRGRVSDLQSSYDKAYKILESRRKDHE